MSIETDLRILREHLGDFNEMYGTSWCLTQPKRRRLGKTVGICKDNNHRLYQVHVDVILARCEKPLTTKGIYTKLVEFGEKESTARLLAPDYFALITKVLNPKTKQHRGVR